MHNTRCSPCARCTCMCSSDPSICVSFPFALFFFFHPLVFQQRRRKKQVDKRFSVKCAHQHQRPPVPKIRVPYFRYVAFQSMFKNLCKFSLVFCCCVNTIAKYAINKEFGVVNAMAVCMYVWLLLPLLLLDKTASAIFISLCVIQLII